METHWDDFSSNAVARYEAYSEVNMSCAAVFRVDEPIRRVLVAMVAAHSHTTLTGKFLGYSARLGSPRSEHGLQL